MDFVAQPLALEFGIVKLMCTKNKPFQSPISKGKNNIAIPVLK